VKNQVIAKRYARALFNLASEEQAVEQYGAEIDGFGGILKEFADLGNALRNPLYPVPIKKTLFQEVASRLQLSPVVRGFLNLLIEKRRIQNLPETTEYYHRLIDEKSNIARAKVRAPFKLEDDEIKELAAALEKKIGMKIVAEFEEDPSLIGGVFAQIGDFVLDGSVKRQLLNFKESLKRGAVG
jgi:F-type H+-transporting ATPase subunit delta